MTNTNLPPAPELITALLAKIDALISLKGTNAYQIQMESGAQRNAIARMRAGQSVTYETLQALSAWVESREAEITAAGGTLSTQASQQP